MQIINKISLTVDLSKAKTEIHRNMAESFYYVNIYG